MAKTRLDFFLAAGQLRSGNEGLPPSSAKGSVATPAGVSSCFTSPATSYLSVRVQPWWLGGGGGLLSASLPLERWQGGPAHRVPVPRSTPTELLSWSAGGMRDKGCSRMGNAEPGRKRKARVSRWSVSGVGLESGRPQDSWLEYGKDTSML